MTSCYEFMIYFNFCGKKCTAKQLTFCLINNSPSKLNECRFNLSRSTFKCICISMKLHAFLLHYLYYTWTKSILQTTTLKTLNTAYAHSIRLLVGYVLQLITRYSTKKTIQTFSMCLITHSFLEEQGAGLGAYAKVGLGEPEAVTYTFFVH